MPEPIYNIKLFYGDMKFTNDYSNVLQFNTKELRDSYFDAIETSYEIQNTESNRVMFDGGVVKVALPITMLVNLDKINYCYMSYALVDNINFVQNRKYYFINSYEIISSNENTTVVAFTLEYDVWQNNQFDFTLRESNIERMHVDRWEKTSNDLKFKRPILDAIESNMKVDKKYQIEFDTPNTIKRVTKQGNVYVPTDAESTPVIWVMVTAIHTFGKQLDQMLYHFFPVVYKRDDLVFDYTDPSQDDYFIQNAIYVGKTLIGGVESNIFFPSLQALDSEYLAFACGNGSNNDTVKILNVQFFNNLPMLTLYENDFGVIRLFNTFKLKMYLGLPNIWQLVTGEPVFLASYATADLSLLSKLTDNTNHWNYSYDGISKPIKPSDNANYSPSYEPALYMNPVRKRFISVGDLSAIGEIPDILFIKNIFNNISGITVTQKVSFSAMSAYCYYYIGNDRLESNTEGFAFIKPSYLGDIISDAWKDYLVNQRDSDRAMMWTNIVTGGLSEAGSTAVSAGIGWRSNMERAYSMQNTSAFIKSQQIHTARQGNMEKNQYYKQLRGKQLNPTSDMYGGMAKNAMMMSGIGGVTAFSANAIHQGLAQRNKEKAIQNTPGTLAKSGNAIGSIIDNQFKVYYIETIVDDTSFEKYKMMFMKYGYYIGTVELPNINSRKYFNYIKTNGAIVTGSCNNLFLSYIASIFDNGVTIWHMDYTTYSTIYDYTKENIERSLM